MNILFLTDELNYADGVSSQLFYLAKGLIKREDINLSIMCSGGDAPGKFRKSGINVIENNNLNHKSRSIKKFITALGQVSHFCKKNKTDIIHSHNHYAANIASTSLKIRLPAGIKTIQTVHGIVPERGKLHLLNANYYTAVNDHVSTYLSGKIKDKNRLTLIYNGIDFNENKSKIFNEKLRFVSAGRLEKGKRVELFIQAVSKLSGEYREKAEFIIAGEGSEENSLKELNGKLKAGIEFTGTIKDMRKYFETSDVLVVTSESEGLPMTILEAASEKVLVLTSGFEGIENIIKDNFDGLVFSAISEVGAEELTQKIKYIIDKPVIVKSFTDNFYRNAKSKFDAEFMARKYYELYSNILTQ